MDEFNHRDFSFCTFHCNEQNHHTSKEFVVIYFLFFQEHVFTFV
jgi:hypothetical protein